MNNWNETNLKCQVVQFRINRIRSYPIETSWNEFIIPQTNFVCNIEPEPREMEDYEIETFSISIFGSGVRGFVFEENEEYTERIRRNWIIRNQPIRNNMITINRSRSVEISSTTNVPRKRRSLSKQENQSMTITGDKQKWNRNNRAQKIAKLVVVGEKRAWELELEKVDNIFIMGEPNDEEVIDYNDHNRLGEQSLKRTVRATIRKVHNEYDSDELDDIDPLGCLKKHHKTTKYDKYFQFTYNRPKTKGDFRIEKMEYERLSDDEKYRDENVEVGGTKKIISGRKKEYVSPTSKKLINIPRVERVRKFDYAPQKREKIIITKNIDNTTGRRGVSGQPQSRQETEQGQVIQRHIITHQVNRPVASSQVVTSRVDIQRVLQRGGSRATSRERRIEYLRDTNEVNNNQYM